MLNEVTEVKIINAMNEYRFQKNDEFIRDKIATDICDVLIEQKIKKFTVVCDSNADAKQTVENSNLIVSINLPETGDVEFRLNRNGVGIHHV